MKTYKITCPACKKQDFGSVEQVYMTYPIKSVSADGDLDYDHDNPMAGNGQVISIQCMSCGYEVQDKNGNPITDSIQVLAWVRHLSSRK